MFAQRQGEAITMTAFTDAITLSGIGAGIDKDSISAHSLVVRLAACRT